MLEAADYQRMSRCFLFVGIQTWRTVGRWSAGRAETQRQCAVSVIVCGSRREELSPAQTEPTNAISVSNTIVLFSQANAIILSPVLRAHSANPRADIWTNFTPYLWCGQNTHNRSEPDAARPRGGTPIVAFLWTGLNNHNSPVCVCVHIYMCVLACVWSCSLMPSQCSIVPWTATVIYVKILSLPSSHPSLFSVAFVALPFLSPVWIPLIRPLSSPPSPSCTVRLCPSFALSLPLSLLHASLPPSASLPAFFFSLPHCRPVLISISSSYTLRSLCLFVVTLPYPAFTWLFHSLPCFMSSPSWLEWHNKLQKVRKKKKESTDFYSH